MITEVHTVEVLCDYPECRALEKIRGDRGGVIAALRAEGWRITTSFPTTAFCPEHAKQHEKRGA